MCQPVTLGAAALGLTAAQTISQAITARREASNTVSIQEQNAQIARQEAQAEASNRRRVGEQDRARFRARLGTAGVTTAGSPVEALAGAAAEAELDALAVLRQGEVRARQSLMARNDAVFVRRRATNQVAFNLGRSLLNNG